MVKNINFELNIVHDFLDPYIDNSIGYWDQFRIAVIIVVFNHDDCKKQKFLSKTYKNISDITKQETLTFLDNVIKWLSTNNIYRAANKVITL